MKARILSSMVAISAMYVSADALAVTQMSGGAGHCMAENYNDQYYISPGPGGGGWIGNNVRTMWLRCGLPVSSTTTTVSTKAGIGSSGSGAIACTRTVYYTTTGGIRTSIATTKNITPSSTPSVIQTIDFGSVTPPNSGTTSRMVADLACYFPSTSNSIIYWIENTY